MKKQYCFILIIIIFLFISGCKIFDQTPPDAPIFSHSDSIVYYEAIEVAITGEEASFIYYTADGSEPNDSSSEYSAPILLSENTTLNAVCIDKAGNDSPIATAKYEIDTVSGSPLISLDDGIYGEDQSITITPDDNTEVFYTFTVDGSEPDNPSDSSTKYGTPIQLSAATGTTVIYKFKFKSFTTASSDPIERSVTESSIVERLYTIDKESPDAPTFSHSDNDVYYNPISVEISGESGSTFYYTTNGSEPSDDDNQYIEPIEISVDTNLKAICVDEVGNVSSLQDAEYIIYVSGISVPFMNIADGKIFLVSKAFEYSLDDAISWTDCNSSVIDVAFLVGDKVWVREKADNAVLYYLGEVESVTGLDIMALNTYVGVNWFDDLDYGSVGDSMVLLTDLRNIGDQTINQSGVDLEFYLSEDTTIDSSDTLLSSGYATITADAGETITLFGTGFHDFVVPDVPPGTYYIGCIIDVNDELNELTHGNNITLPQHVEEFHILDSTAISTGAIKIVNSWGIGFTGEHIADGHYWVTYESAKSLNMAIRYYYNDFSHEYKPTIISVFNLDHVNRDECHIIIGLGDPASPVIEKEFQSRAGSTYYAGDDSFSNNDMVLDISEFASYINSYDLYLRADTSNSYYSGSLNEFVVEYYSDYDAEPIKIIDGATGYIPSGGTTDFTVSTAEALTLFEQEAIMPLDRSSFSFVTFIEEYPSASELREDKKTIGVFEEGKNYNIIIDGKYGTGDIPPRKEEWETMKKLQSIDTGTYYGTLPESVDHSITQYFPPIGNQGVEGSCVAFSLGYYIQTYTEAREHGWNLSTTSWGGNWPGYPLSNQDKIISPDFLYHQINGGAPGANGTIAASFIVRVGGCSWEEMPYSDDDDDNGYYPWPSESAFREAPRYRGRETSNAFWNYNSSGYFIIETDEDINLLRELLAAGYCLNTSVEAPTLYGEFDSNDVVSGYSSGPMSTNHANTIVGYKEGSAWTPSSPDS